MHSLMKSACCAASFINRTVPQWHFSLVQDHARNAAYDAALRRAVTPTSRVLEIGTGTGLLAMMAARAGAAAVVTCEVVPAIAEKATDIVAHNGYGDRVRVVANIPTSSMPRRIWAAAPIFWCQRSSATFSF